MDYWYFADYLKGGVVMGSDIIVFIVKVLGIIAMVLLFTLALYFVVVTFRLILDKRIMRRKLRFKTRVIRFWYKFKRHRYPNLIEFAKWVVIDIFRGKDKLKLFGIWCFTGYYGEGKTLGAVTFAKSMQKKHPHKNIKIYTNFKMRGQDGRIEKWEDLLELPPNSIVVFDEIQSTFTSTKFKDFPIELLWKITQCRKRGLMILCSSPVYSRMVIQLRESTDMVIVCKNVLGLDRWFSYDFYREPEYESALAAQKAGGIRGIGAMQRFRKFHISHVAQDYDYHQYNTHQIVDRLDIVPEDTKPGKVNKRALGEVLTMLDRLQADKENLEEVNKQIKRAVRLLKSAS